MSLKALFKRLEAIEARPSAQRPLRITGDLPSGSQMIESMASGAKTAPPPGNAIDNAVRQSAKAGDPVPQATPAANVAP
jgi:hypothetical protein